MRIVRDRQPIHPITQSPDCPIRPLLKWAGGKRQLLPQLRRFYPRAFNRYIEPFFGSGAVFFDLHASGRLRDRDVVLDRLERGSHRLLRNRARRSPTRSRGELERLAAAHARGGRAHYYAVRDEQFNPLRDRLGTATGASPTRPQLAAMLIYLNRTGFNGLFRVNARGEFNVPAGRYERPRIVDREKLVRVVGALSGARVTLVWGSFDAAADIAEPGDFVYFDPPYAPLSRTANFTSYTAPRFDASDQERLQQLVVGLARRGCHVLVSNSTAEEIAALYEHNADARAAGLRALRVPARRAINSNAARRGPVEEFLITNYAPAGPAS